MDSIKAEFLSLHFISLTSHVEDTSSAFTEESSFAINEVFQIVLEVPLPNGETDITIRASECAWHNSLLPMMLCFLFLCLIGFKYSFQHKYIINLPGYHHVGLNLVQMY